MGIEKCPLHTRSFENGFYDSVDSNSYFMRKLSSRAVTEVAMSKRNHVSFVSLVLLARRVVKIRAAKTYWIHLVLIPL